MLYRSVAGQARDERQIKTTLFPLSPSPCQIKFELFHLLSHLSLFPGTTWNYLEPSRLTIWWCSVIDAYIEPDSLKPSLLCFFFFSLTHFKSSLSGAYVLSVILLCFCQRLINIHARNVKISFAGFNVQKWLIYKGKCWRSFSRNTCLWCFLAYGLNV